MILKQQGASLIEIMVALTVSMFIMLGIFQVFLGVSASVKVSSALARVQETGRFTLDFLVRDFRMIGYHGCIDTDQVSVNILADNSPTTLIQATELQGFRIQGDGSWSPAKSTNFNAGGTMDALNPLTDVIYVQHAMAGVSEVASGSASVVSPSGNVTLVDNDFGYSTGDLLIISDCAKADLFEVTGAAGLVLQHGSSENSSGSFSDTYASGSRVMEFSAKAYYIQDTGRDNSQGDPVFGMYLYDVLANANQEQEIIEGVERFVIEYGQVLANGNVRYVNVLDGNLDLGEVDRLRISVMVTSTEPVLSQDDASIYQLVGFSVGPVGTAGVDATYANDRRLRKTFSTTFGLRNRE